MMAVLALGRGIEHLLVGVFGLEILLAHVVRRDGRRGERKQHRKQDDRKNFPVRYGQQVFQNVFQHPPHTVDVAIEVKNPSAP